MRSGLELHDSRVSQIDLLDGVATLYFSHAYIHKSTGTPGRGRGTGWSQAAQLILSEVRNQPTWQGCLPNTISDGFLEVGGIKHAIIPLPFKRKVEAYLYFLFMDGRELTLTGAKPFIELLGTPTYLEDNS